LREDYINDAGADLGVEGLGGREEWSILSWRRSFAGSGLDALSGFAISRKYSPKGVGKKYDQYDAPE